MIMSGKIRSRYNGDGSLITGDQWRAMAAESRKRSQDSWERSDTDGFMSQWASDTVAREYAAWADLADNGYQAEFPAIFDLDGNLMDARQAEGTWGPYWIIRHADRTVTFFNESNARKGATRYRNDTRKGYRVGSISCDAYVKLSGASYTSVGPCLYPIADSVVTIIDDATTADGYHDYQ